METAGIAQLATAGREWFAVRGVSDYGDGRRTKDWRNYASLAAAAYTRALLAQCSPQSLDPLSLATRLIAWVSVGLVVAAIYTALVVLPNDNQGPVQITDQVAVGNAQSLGNGEPATIEIPSPPGRRYLDITARLDNPSQVGDCAHSASMDLIAIIDGQARPALTSRRAGDEVTVDLDGTQHSAKIVITVDMPDKSCHVNLSISKAVLRN